MWISRIRRSLKVLAGRPAPMIGIGVQHVDHPPIQVGGAPSRDWHLQYYDLDGDMHQPNWDYKVFPSCAEAVRRKRQLIEAHGFMNVDVPPHCKDEPDPMGTAIH